MIKVWFKAMIKAWFYTLIGLVQGHDKGLIQKAWFKAMIKKTWFKALLKANR